FRPLTEVAPVVNTSCCPSRTNQTGITWGLPSLMTVATFAVRVPWVRNKRTSSRLISAGMVDPSPFAVTGRGYPRGVDASPAERLFLYRCQDRATLFAGWVGVLQEGGAELGDLAPPRRRARARRRSSWLWSCGLLGLEVVDKAGDVLRHQA